MTNAGAPRSGWFVDPLGPLGRRRWWSGAGWTARVAEPDEHVDGIAWRPDLADTPAPICWFAPGYTPRPAAPVTVTVAPPPVPTAPLMPPAPLEPMPPLEPVEPVPVAELPAPVDVPRRGTSRPTKVAAVLVAAAVVAFAAGGGAAIFGDGGRPELAPVTVYRDPDAGFALRYRDEWRVQSDTPGRSIRFSIGDAGASAFATNNVSIVIGAEANELPALEQAVNDVTPRLHEEFAGIRLEAADRTELAGGPALRLEFADVSHQPPITVQQFLGRTTAGKLLAVTITIREPRTAPTTSELLEFLDSITSL